MNRLLCLALVCVAACQSSAGADALVTSAIALSAAAANRASGGCYAACPTGTTCNGATGLCDELPCRGRCGEGSYCEQGSRIPQCVRLKPVELKISQPENAPVPASSDAPTQASGL